jgi:hypothetical protein
MPLAPFGAGLRRKACISCASAVRAPRATAKLCACQSRPRQSQPMKTYVERYGAERGRRIFRQYVQDRLPPVSEAMPGLRPSAGLVSDAARVQALAQGNARYLRLFGDAVC